jgi:predicted aspartyl protease
MVPGGGIAMAQVLSLVLALLTLSCFSSAQTKVGPQIGINLPPGDEFDKSEPSRTPSSLPFKLHAGYLVVVEGRVGTFTGLKFLLDTGATNSVLSRKIADKLSLLRRPGRVINFDKTLTTEWVTAPDVQFGDIQERNVSMLVGTLAHLQAEKVDAVIGLDILRKFSFSIDYHSGTVEFGFPDPASFSIPIDSNAICLTAEVQIGDRKFRLIVDTGMPGILLF